MAKALALLRTIVQEAKVLEAHPAGLWQVWKGVRGCSAVIATSAVSVPRLCKKISFFQKRTSQNSKCVSLPTNSSLPQDSWMLAATEMKIKSRAAPP